MNRFGKILAVGALVAAPLAVATIPAQPADAQFYVGVGPAYPSYPYACSYYDPYYCPNYAYGYGYGVPGYVGFGWGGWGGYYGHGWHGGGHYGHRAVHGGGGRQWHR